MNRRRVIPFIALVFLLVAPLAGGLARGLRTGFFDYPPLIVELPVKAPFAWPVFVLFAGLIVLMAGLVFRPTWFGFSAATQHGTKKKSRLPGWGWFGLGLTLVSWIGAWGRFEWMGCIRNHMFPPLWFGYVLSMDGLVFLRTGTSLIARSRRRFIVLFPASAAAWWYFEYLNRFIQNWWYDGIESFGSLHYIFYSTLCFSTVLPGIFETHEYLLSFDKFRFSFRHGLVFKPFSKPMLAVILASGVCALAFVGLFPDEFFFLTWLAPLAVLEGALGLADVRTPFQHLRDGDYTMLVGLAVAALVCGFFWEMWNFFSLPQWHYSVPYVNVLHIFEMPLVGYGGYFPFGPVCWCFWLTFQFLSTGSAPDEKDNVIP